MKIARLAPDVRSPVRVTVLLLLPLIALLMASASTARAACEGEGEPCDGPDSDLCLEGVIECDGDIPVCGDTSGNTLDSCDGIDNDCNPATPDGADEAGVGLDCDGPDTDLCEEGILACLAGALSCSDASGDNQDTCDGIDNDCNPATPDGVDEPGVGLDCDGPDTDLCEEGVIECTAGTLLCTDDTGDDPVCAPPIPALTGDARNLLIVMIIATAGLLLLGGRRQSASLDS